MQYNSLSVNDGEEKQGDSNNKAKAGVWVGGWVHIIALEIGLHVVPDAANFTNCFVSGVYGEATGACSVLREGGTGSILEIMSC